MTDHGQRVNWTPHVILTGWFPTGQCNVNKNKNKNKTKKTTTNNPFMAAYEINLKRELTLKSEQRKQYNHIGRIYPTLF